MTNPDNKTAERNVAQWTAEEINLHRAFAYRCVRAQRFEELSSRFSAMKDECRRLNVRPCSFTEFRAYTRTLRQFVNRGTFGTTPPVSSAPTFRLRGETANALRREIDDAPGSILDWSI